MGGARYLEQQSASHGRALVLAEDLEEERIHLDERGEGRVEARIRLGEMEEDRMEEHIRCGYGLEVAQRVHCRFLGLGEKEEALLEPCARLASCLKLA